MPQRPAQLYREVSDERIPGLYYRNIGVKHNYYRTVSPPTRAEVERVALAHIRGGMRVIVTAVIKQSPNHLEGNSIDLAIRFAKRQHPVERSESLRLTDKRLYHARLKQLRFKLAIVIENDHLHISDEMPWGVYIYDNPRRTYAGEDKLLNDREFRRHYSGKIRELIPA